MQQNQCQINYSSKSPLLFSSFPLLKRFSSFNVFIFSLSALLFSLFLFGSYSASATSPSSATSSVNVNFINGIAIRILDKTGTSEITNLPMELLASPGGSFINDNFLVEVDTSNRTGYKLYMTSDYVLPNSTSSASPTYTTALVNLEDSDYTIPTLSSTVTKTDFSAGGNYVNHWGYSLDDTTYSPVPVHSTSDEIDTSSSPATHDQTAVYVAANVDLSKGSGRYQNSLVFSAIANPIPTAYTLSFNLNGGSAPSSDPTAFADMTASEVAAQHSFTIPTAVPELTGHTFSYWSDTAGNHYNPGDTITVIGNEEYIGIETLTANWDLATYTISIANSNTTSNPASSTTISYGGTTTVTVTPSSGYYLSSVTCPTGYACSGYNTGTSYTGTQTVTITNNSTASGGTLSFAGTIAHVYTCTSPATLGNGDAGDLKTYNNIQYICLADSHWYTKSSQGSDIWPYAASKCPSGTHLPTKAEFDTLVSKYSGGGLSTATGWSGNYWSATSANSGLAYVLGVNSSNAGVGGSLKSDSYYVVCMAG